MSFNPPLIQLPKGVKFDYTPTPKFTTTLQVPQSGRHPASATLQESTIFDIELVFEYLSESSFQYLKAFYEAMRGAFGWFLFDPSQYYLADMTLTEDYTQLASGYMGQGDGSTKTFAMWRATSLNGPNVTLLERIQSVSSFAGVYLDGVVQPVANYTQTDLPGQITFTTAPGNLVNIAWAGSYRYLCRFSDDTAEFEEFSYQLYRMKTLKLTTVNL